jgi:hypothetical protein
MNNNPKHLKWKIRLNTINKNNLSKIVEQQRPPTGRKKQSGYAPWYESNGFNTIATPSITTTWEDG